MWGVNRSFCSFTFLHVKDEQKNRSNNHVRTIFTPFLLSAADICSTVVKEHRDSCRNTSKLLWSSQCANSDISRVIWRQRRRTFLIYLVFLFRQTESDSAGQHLPDQNELAERGRFIRSVRSFINSISYRPSPWIYRSYGLINRLIEDRSTSCVF